jgi:hypothetical protein
VGAACAEWHLHAWDLAATLGKDYQPASPELLAAGWQAGIPHRPLRTIAPRGVAVAGAPARGAGGNGRAGVPPPDGAWEALLRASGRVPR